MAAAHSWDDFVKKPKVHTSGHVWEDRSDTDSSSVEDSDSDDELTPSKAANEVLCLFVGMLMGGTMKAKTFCILCYYLGKAGLEVFVKYGKAPDTGHFSRHLKELLGNNKHDEILYHLPFPGIRKHDLARSLQN